MRSFNLSTRVVGFAIVMLSLMAGGCVRIAHPVLKDDQVTTDDALLGKWVSDDGKVHGEMKAGAAGKGENHEYKLSYTNQQGETGNFLVRLGKIGDKTVAEVTADALPPTANDEARSLTMPLYTLFVIEVTSPKVSLRAIDIEWLKKYTRAHPDELDTIGPREDLIVNASTEAFQAFCIRHFKDDGMLSEANVFVRPGDATTQPAIRK